MLDLTEVVHPALAFTKQIPTTTIDAVEHLSAEISTPRLRPYVPANGSERLLPLG